MSRSNNKKIVIITSQAFSLLNFRLELMKDMIGRGYKVYAMAPDYSKIHKIELEKSGVIPIDINLSRTSLNPFMSFYELIRLFYRLWTIKPNSVLCYFAKSVLIGNIAAFFAGIRHRYTIIEGLGNSRSYISNSLMYKLFFIYFYKIALFKTKKVFFTNNDDKDFFLLNRIIKEKVTVLLGGIGVDLNFWDCPRKYIKENKIITFIMATRLLRTKGVMIYLEAAEKIKNKFDNVNLILIGDVDNNPSSINEDELNYYIENEIVEWPGNVYDVKSWLCKSDIFVLPSYYGEGVPRSIQEAMSCSMPIITTNWIGCKDSVADGRNGILVPIKDSESLYSAMSFYINNRNQITKHGNLSRVMAVDTFNIFEKNKMINDYICS